MTESLTFEQYSRKRNLTHFDTCVAKEAWGARQPEVSALTAERDDLKRELEVAQAGCVEMQKACKNAAWLYDEMALGPLEAAAKYGDNYEPPSDKVCLAIREALHNVVTFPNPGAPLIAELTKLREVVKAGDELAERFCQRMGEDSFQEHQRFDLQDRESLRTYLAAKSALEVKG